MVNSRDVQGRSERCACIYDSAEGRYIQQCQEHRKQARVFSVPEQVDHRSFDRAKSFERLMREAPRG